MKKSFYIYTFGSSSSLQYKLNLAAVVRMGMNLDFLDPCLRLKVNSCVLRFPLLFYFFPFLYFFHRNWPSRHPSIPILTVFSLSGIRLRYITQERMSSGR